MGAVFKKPKAPEPPPPPPPPAPEEKAPMVGDKMVRSARQTIRRRAAVAQGRDDDIHTNPLGAPTRAAIARQSLLGR